MLLCRIPSPLLRALAMQFLLCSADLGLGRLATHNQQNHFSALMTLQGSTKEGEVLYLYAAPFLSQLFLLLSEG